ncbi:MAG: flagellar hook-basal body complex protein [Bryobacteraceae bacterium]
MTSGPLDGAIQGSGFFVANTATNEKLFTRDGSFTVDADGYVVTLTGEKVQQLKNDVLSSVKIPTSLSNPSATTKMSVTANLNAGATVGQPSGTFSTPVEVVDSLGAKHVLTVQYTKTAANAWTADVYVNGAEVGTPGTPLVSVGTVALTFDTAGKLLTPLAAAGSTAVLITGLTTNAANMSFNYDLYDSSGNALITQFAGSSVASSLDSDGFEASELAGASMSDGESLWLATLTERMSRLERWQWQC